MCSMTPEITSAEVGVFSGTCTLLLLLLATDCSLRLERPAGPDPSLDVRSVGLTVASMQRVHVRPLRLNAQPAV